MNEATKEQLKKLKSKIELLRGVTRLHEEFLSQAIINIDNICACDYEQQFAELEAKAAEIEKEEKKEEKKEKKEK
jgi:hypothetical protein